MARILVFTGDGKGKSTAAFGLVLRAAGQNLPVLVVQFLKARAEVGELRLLRELPGVVVEQHGLGFLPPPDSPRRAAHRAAAEAGLARVAAAVAAGTPRVLILDEVNQALAHGLLGLPAVLALLDALPGDAIAVLTGRDAPAELIARADTATEMKCLKHAFDAGMAAQRGVEY